MTFKIDNIAIDFKISAILLTNSLYDFTHTEEKKNQTNSWISEFVHFQSTGYLRDWWKSSMYNSVFTVLDIKHFPASVWGQGQIETDLLTVR